MLTRWRLNQWTFVCYNSVSHNVSFYNHHTAQLTISWTQFLNLKELLEDLLCGNDDNDCNNWYLGERLWLLMSTTQHHRLQVCFRHRYPQLFFQFTPSIW